MLRYIWKSVGLIRDHAPPADETASEEELLDELSRLCRLPIRSVNSTVRIADERVQHVAQFLSIFDDHYARPDHKRWAKTPRTYIVLSNLGIAEYFMDQFIDQGFTDFNLPYSHRTLPPFIQPDALRNKFQEIQNYVLTDAKKLEELSDARLSSGMFSHIYLEGSADQHFRRVRSLGQGSFG